MTTIYHNPRCRKSRETLQLLEDRNEKIETILYLEEPPTTSELKTIIKKLGISPIELIRKGEAIWKDNYRGKTLTDAEVLQAMIDHPKLIERPIVLKDGKAALGRPPENILKIL